MVNIEERNKLRCAPVWNSAKKNVASVEEMRHELKKKRSVHAVHEQFSSIHNEVSSSAVVFLCAVSDGNDAYP